MSEIVQTVIESLSQPTWVVPPGMVNSRVREHELLRLLKKARIALLVPGSGSEVVAEIEVALRSSGEL